MRRKGWPRNSAKKAHEEEVIVTNVCPCLSLCRGPCRPCGELVLDATDWRNFPALSSWRVPVNTVGIDAHSDCLEHKSSGLNSAPSLDTFRPRSSGRSLFPRGCEWQGPQHRLSAFGFAVASAGVASSLPSEHAEPHRQDAGEVERKLGRLKLLPMGSPRLVRLHPGHCRSPASD